MFPTEDVIPQKFKRLVMGVLSVSGHKSPQHMETYPEAKAKHMLMLSKQVPKCSIQMDYSPILI